MIFSNDQITLTQVLMKDTHSCPKCNSTNIYKMKGSTMNQSTIVYLNKWMTKYVILDRYLCTSCGYSEDFAPISKKERKWLNEVMDTPDEHDSDYV